jgi:hypothetical protein
VLKAKYEIIQKIIQTLTKKNESLRYSQRNKPFAMGVLFMLCVLVIGLVIGR